MAAQPDKPFEQGTLPQEKDDLGSIKLELPLPTELIADEYQHVDNKNGLIYVIRANNKSDRLSTEVMRDKLQNLGYNVPDENVCVIGKKRDVLLYLHEISAEDHLEKSCLIVIFLGEIERDNSFITEDNKTISMSEVWSPFINCRSLKSTPKTFIFQAYKLEKQTETDEVFAVAGRVYRDEHDIPTEADVLVVYKRIGGASEEKLKFMNKLCEVIDFYGKRDDLIGLFTRIDHGDNQPLIISTLTKKFYLSSSMYRDYYYDLKEMGSSIVTKIDKMETRVGSLENSRRRKRSSFRRVVDGLTNKRENLKSPATPEMPPLQEHSIPDSSIKSVSRTSSLKRVTQNSSIKRPTKLNLTPTSARHWKP